ncbi:hypothetical protein Tco_0343968 [Tanacetum coccineum]
MGLKKGVTKGKDGVYRVLLSLTGKNNLLMRRKKARTLTAMAVPNGCAKFNRVKGGNRQEAGQINWVEQTTDEELNHALMAFTVNNEVSMCSKLCLDTYNALQAKYDELQSEFGDQEAALVAHKLAVKKLESQLKVSHKQQSSLTEKLNFQANQIFEKDEKLKKYRRIGMKAVKDKDALQKIVDSWFASSKNLWKLIDCGMSSTVKIGLGYGIQSNAEVLGYEEEMDREDIDDSLYVEGKFGPHPQSPSHTESEINHLFTHNAVHPMTVMGNKELIGKGSAFKSTRVVHANVRQATPAWTNSNRVNKANQFTPRPVQLSNIRPNLSTASNTIKTGRVNVIYGHGSVNSALQVHIIMLLRAKWALLLRTSAGCVWRKAIPLSNTNSGPTPNSNVTVSRGPQGRPKPVKAWVKGLTSLSKWLRCSGVECLMVMLLPLNRHGVLVQFIFRALSVRTE